MTNFEVNMEGNCRNQYDDHMSFLFRHAVLLAGYSNSSQAFIVRNSWGDEWVRSVRFTK